eukprot:TRINITY_DN3168_c0_g2_i1.p1 TRINITY_DN3168_c0_g2~~TRINITY_DN3168_c0_g2_i1.p1  ORF type:complete len:298 (-),score=58.58 TRINITY_DN3168_c0_g2_i1:66-959(-)
MEATIKPQCPPLKILAIPNAGQLSYRTSSGKGDPVIFLHGLLGSSRTWGYQFASLSQSINNNNNNNNNNDWEITAWDAPGYGDSSLIEANIDSYVETLHHLIITLYPHGHGEGQNSVRKVSLVGHSMGGVVASRYAAKYPDRLKCLVLSCTHPGYGDPESTPPSEKLNKRMQELQEIGREAYGRNRARDLLPFPNIPQEIMEYCAGVAAETNPDGLRLASRMLQLADNRPLLPQITVPTLILTGEKDTVVRPDLLEDLLKLTPYKKHVNMPGLAHAPYFQAPEYYNTLLCDFIFSCS